MNIGEPGVAILTYRLQCFSVASQPQKANVALMIEGELVCLCRLCLFEEW